MNSKKLFISLWTGYALFLLFWMVRFWGHFPAFMDTLEYVFPEKWFNVASFQKGLIPLWNPYIACGTPHVANFQSAAFYPLFWIWNLTGLTHWFFIVGLSHGFLAAVGFYLWLRSLKVSSGIASLCAVSFSASAYLTFLWGFPTHLASLAWIPWIFWGSRRLLHKFSRGRWVLLSSFWALQILAGYPSFTFYAILFWIVFIGSQIGLKGKTWLAFLSALGLSIFITACQWLPFVDFLGYMRREAWGINLYNLNWAEYKTFFCPDALGMPGSAAYQGGYPNYIFDNFYLGIIPLGLLVWSLWKQKGNLGFWQKSLLFWLLLPLGINFFVWRIFPSGLLSKLEVSKSSFLFPLCAFTALAVFLNEAVQKVPKKSWLRRYAHFFVLIWVLDLVLVPFRIVPVVPDPYQNPGVKTLADHVKAAAGDGRIVSLRTEDDVYSSSVTDYAGSFQETALRLTQNTNVVWGIKSAQGHLTTVVDGYQNFSTYLREGFPYDGRVLDAAGVDLIITSQLLPAFKYSVHEPLLGWNLIHNAGAMPGQWETGSGKTLPDRAQSFGSLLSPKAFLENECTLDQGPDGLAAALAPVSQYSHSTADSPCAFQFATSANDGKYFIFDQCFAPGWHAWVDGSPSPILRVNGLWMGVAVSPRVAHQIAFQYSPLSFRLGLFLSLIALAVFFMLGVQIRSSR